MQQSKDRLASIQSSLHNFVSSTTGQLKNRFSAITSECTGLISRCPLKFIDYFVKVWFRAFVGMKDECLVLINGQLIRPYHMKDHEKFIHSRGHEDSYYKGTKLSSCCIDGIDFEYRVFTDKYGHKLGIDKIADQNETLSSSLHDLAHTMDELTASIVSALKKRGVKNLKLHIRHKEEAITGVLTKEDGSTMNISYTREVFEKCQRSVCLSTIVELPPEMTVKQGTTAPSTNAGPVTAKETAGVPTASTSVSGTSVSRSKLSIYDSDDEKEKQESLAAAAALQQQRQLEQHRQAMNFGMDVSLDDIKRSLGASSELLTTGSRLEDSSGIVAMDVVGDCSSTTALSDGPLGVLSLYELKSVPIEVEGVPSAQYKTMQLLVLSPQTSSSSSSSDVSALGLTSVPLSVELSSFKSLTQGSPNEYEEYFSVSEVLDEVCKKMWLTPFVEAMNKYAAPLQVSSMWFPIQIAVEKKLHSRGEYLRVPVLEGKRYRVVCESHPTVLKLMGLLLDWVKTKDSIAEGVQHRQKSEGINTLDRRPLLFWSHFPFIRRLCRRLATGQNIDFSSSEELLPDCDSEMVGVLLQSVRLCLNESSHEGASLVPLCINLRCASTLVCKLSVWTQYCEEISASSCGMTFDDLQKCTTDWKRLAVTSDPKEGFSLVVIRFDLSYNHFLADFDHDWMISESPDASGYWLDWCEWLLCHAPALSVVNLSHCITSPLQASVLCRGLQSALAKRHQAGLLPLSSLLLHGLQQVSPTASSDLRTSLTTSEGRLMGVISIDSSGVTYCL